ncbi:hypothetical protein BJ912DRAFT_907979 [Pholiota molesta]|nr:hypothetical protein BJ912DRAFT_907979 [Pholiota molesta]
MAEARPSADMGPSVVEPLYQVKLLSALRSGDPAVIHPFLAEIGKDKRKSLDGHIDTGAAALHLAVRCGSVQTVSLLLAHRAISPNGIHPPGSGTTPLHLAASLGRLDIVTLLLEQENIDDSLRDSHGRTCRDVARGKDVIRAIDDSRHFLNASYRSLLRSYILSPLNDPPSPALIHLLELPRVKFVDLSYLDDDTGTSLLHEAARRKDLRLIELAVRAGADVFVRNRKGKMAYEGVGKDDRVRVFLRQFANHDKTLISNSAPITEAPALKGYLNKYTNVAKGYNTRWFVLKNGVLSYYRHQDDETVASRGSISMKTAVLHPGERSRFEVHSLPARGQHSHSGVQKWYMKANHPVEAHRWIEAISKSIEWYKQREAQHESDASSMTNSISKNGRRRSGESDTSGIRMTPSIHSQTLSGSMRRKSTLPSGTDQDSLTGATTDAADASPNLLVSDRPPADGSMGGENDAGDEDNDGEDSSSSNSETRFPPHDNFEIQGNAASAQLELTTQLLQNFEIPPGASQRALDTQSALKDSLSTTQALLNEYLQMAREREEWWARQLKKERARQRFWEESLAVVVKEGETLEQELRARSRRRGSRVFGPSAAGTVTAPPEKKRPSLLGIGLPGSLAGVPSPVPEESPASVATSSPPPTAVDADYQIPAASPPPVPPLPAGLGPAASVSTPPRQPLRSSTADSLATLGGQPRRPPYIALDDARITPVKKTPTMPAEDYDRDTDATRLNPTADRSIDEGTDGSVRCVFVLA